MSMPIAIIAGEPNSISSEIIFRSWKLKKKYIYKPLFIIGSFKLLNLQMKKLKYKIRIKKIDKHFKIQDLNGIELTLEAFNRLFFGIGDELLLLMVFVFGISSLFTYSYYGVKCLGYLTSKKWGPWYNYIYIVSIVMRYMYF